MSVNDYDEELYLAIEDLVGCGDLEEGTPAFGIARRVVHQGYDSLSPKQKHVYDALVVPALVRLHERNETNRILSSNPD